MHDTRFCHLTPTPIYTLAIYIHKIIISLYMVLFERKYLWTLFQSLLTGFIGFVLIICCFIVTVVYHVSRNAGVNKAKKHWKKKPRPQNENTQRCVSPVWLQLLLLFLFVWRYELRSRVVIIITTLTWWKYAKNVLPERQQRDTFRFYTANNILLCNQNCVSTNAKTYRRIGNHRHNQ